MSEDGELPLVEQIAEAGSPAALAALLLRVPDALVLSHGVDLSAACAALSFPLGEHFVLRRSVALHAVRDAHGLMPGLMAAEIETLRVALSRLASGAR